MANPQHECIAATTTSADVEEVEHTITHIQLVNLLICCFGGGGTKCSGEQGDLLCYTLVITFKRKY